MSNLINSIITRFNAVNRRNLLAKALMIAFALFGTFLLNTEANAQSYLPIETQVYLDLTQLCMQKGDAQCAAAALTKAVQSYPLLAQNPQVVNLLRTLKARAGSNGAANPGGYNPGFNTPRSQPRVQPNYEEYNRCMENARPMSGVNRIYMEGTCRQWLGQ